MKEPNNTEKDWLEWIAEVMVNRPKGNTYLESERGIEVGKLMIDFARQDFAWHRIEPDIFWIDVQFYVKYKLDDKEILFIEKMQPGTVNYYTHAKERNAYAEMRRGIDKLKKINDENERT